MGKSMGGREARCVHRNGLWARITGYYQRQAPDPTRRERLAVGQGEVSAQRGADRGRWNMIIVVAGTKFDDIRGQQVADWVKRTQREWL
jgi:hypothetical protein